MSTTEGSAYSDDYQGFELKEVNFKKNETKKKVTVETIADSKSETDSSNPSEYFWFDLFKTKADAENFNYHNYAEGHIKDNAAQKLAVDTYSYNITSSTVDNNGNITGVNEGSDVIFTITRTRADGQNIGSNDKASTVYVSTAEGTAYEEDYVGLNLKAVTFKKTETKLEIPVSTKKDSVAESGDDEFFYFDLFETKADAENYNYSAYSMGHIKDVADNTASAAAYEYEVNKGQNLPLVML